MQIDECKYFVDPDRIKNKKYCEKGDLLIAGVSVSKESVGMAVAYLGNEKPMIGDEIRLIKHQQNPKFLSYMFSTKYIRKQIESISKPTTVFNLYSTQLKKIKIPIPSLEEQERIVQTLDKFNNNLKRLDNKTQELIQHREKQYSFHCNQILLNV